MKLTWECTWRLIPAAWLFDVHYMAFIVVHTLNISSIFCQKNSFGGDVERLFLDDKCFVVFKGCVVIGRSASANNKCAGELICPMLALR